MARRKSTTLTEVELEFMQIIWAHEESSTDDIQTTLKKKGRMLTDGAIRRVLAILMEKGYLTRRREGIGFYYRARIGEKHAHKKIFQDLLDRAFDGSGPTMIAALFDSLDVSPDEMNELKQLIEDRERRDDNESV